MAANDNKDDNVQPIGQRIRNLIEPALDDPRRPALQLQKLDHIFNQLAAIVPRQIEQEFTHFSRYVEKAAERDPEIKHPMIIEALTVAGQDGESSYNPIKKYGLPISTTFTDFASADIKDLPGYIKLHETARDLDISLKLMGVTAEESRGGMGMPPPQSTGAGTASSLQLNPPRQPAQTERKRTPSLFERITGSLQHTVENAMNAREDHSPRRSGGGSTPSFHGGAQAMQKAPAQGSLNIESPAAKPKAAEDELDIPAFLRRQAN